MKYYQGHFFELLALLFIYLKLTHQIDWAWWAVLAPIWIPVVLATCLVLLLYYGPAR